MDLAPVAPRPELLEKLTNILTDNATTEAVTVSDCYLIDV